MKSTVKMTDGLGVLSWRPYLYRMHMSQPLMIGSEVFRATKQRREHPLGIPRVSLTTDLCRLLGWVDDRNYIDSPRATKLDLADFHDLEYIDAVEASEKLGWIDPALAELYHIGVNGNSIFDGMFRRPATACGGGLLAANRLAGAGGAIFNIGGGQHHGRPDRASGFCYFNEPALTIRALLRFGVERVFYVDLDAHQGDGVQDAFLDEPRVYTLSVHEAGRWPMAKTASPGDLGTVEDSGPAHRNLPVSAGFNDTELELLMEVAVLPLIQDFRPNVIYFQGGCDSLADDPQSKLMLSNTALWRALAIVSDAAPGILVSGGGGYNPYAVGRCWAGYWATLNGFDIPASLPEPAQNLLGEITWTHRLGRHPERHWLCTVADNPRPGRLREETKDMLRKAIRQ